MVRSLRGGGLCLDPSPGQKKTTLSVSGDVLLLVKATKEDLSLTFVLRQKRESVLLLAVVSVLSDRVVLRAVS